MKIRAICLALCNITVAQAFTITEQTPRPYDCSTCETLSHEPLSARWLLKNNAVEDVPSNKMSSRQYAFYTTGAALKAGLPIMLDAPEAVIRMTPTSPQSLMNSQFFIQSQQGQIIPLENSNAINLLSDADNPLALNRASDFITQLKPELGSGHFILKSQSHDLQDNEQVQVTILHHSDNAYLSIETDRSMYVYGNPINITVTSSGKIAGNPVINVEAEIVSPTNEHYPLSLSRLDTTTYQATATLLNEVNSSGENWSIFAEATAMDKNGKILKSKIRTAFSYAIPSGIIKSVAQDLKDPMTYHLILDVATGSRYAINAVLANQDDSNQSVPLEMVQIANWFEPGEHPVTVTFSSDELKTYQHLGLSQLEVLDYGQLRKVFEYRAP